MNIKEEDSKIINLKPKGEKDNKEKGKNLLNKNQLRYSKAVKNNYFNFYRKKINLKKKKYKKAIILYNI